MVSEGRVLESTVYPSVTEEVVKLILYLYEMQLKIILEVGGLSIFVQFKTESGWSELY